MKFASLIRTWNGFEGSIFSNHLGKFENFVSDHYWCTNVNDEYVILCYRNQNNKQFTGESECLVSNDGMQFTEPGSDNHIVYELNHDYDGFAKMTTFMGQAVIVGQTASPVQKYVEVFNSKSKQWELKTTVEGEFYLGDNSIEMIAYYGLVAYKNKLMHLGGNNIVNDNPHSAKQLFYLDSSFGKWKRSTKYRWTTGAGMGLSLYKRRLDPMPGKIRFGPISALRPIYMKNGYVQKSRIFKLRFLSKLIKNIW